MRLAPTLFPTLNRAVGAADPVASPGAAVTTEEFAALLARFAPFERKPHLGVGVSGGRDSLALTLLADQWTRACGGSLTALIVDHRLRPESSAEARHVAALLRGRSIATEILAWDAAKPETGVSEAARMARYALLQARCRELGILHLLLGHQRGDQAETVLLRLADGSGPEGLAGMASVVHRADLRLLRPLLGIDRARLAATVRQHGLSWVDDPGNQRGDSTRIIARRALGVDAVTAFDEVASRSAQARAAIERRLAALAVELIDIDSRGFAWIDLARLLALPPRFARRLVGRLAATIGGRHYPARGSAIERALTDLAAARDAVAGGCRFLRRGPRLLVCREAGAIASPVLLMHARPMLWDGRYVIAPDVAAVGSTLGVLGEEGRLAALRQGVEMLQLLPAPVAEALPALRRNGELVAVFVPREASIGASRGGGRAAPAPATVIACPDAAFRPAQAVASLPWALVLPPGKPM